MGESSPALGPPKSGASKAMTSLVAGRAARGARRKRVSPRLERHITSSLSPRGPTAHHHLLSMPGSLTSLLLQPLASQSTRPTCTPPSTACAYAKLAPVLVHTRSDSMPRSNGMVTLLGLLQAPLWNSVTVTC